MYSMQQLLETLTDKKNKWDYYYQRLNMLPNSSKPNITDLYEYLIKVALFSNNGISHEELINHMNLSANTVRSRLSLIPESLLIEKRQKSKKTIC